MVTRAASSPRLRAVTRPLVELPDVTRLADPAHPLLWTRGDRGCVGIGETLRLEFAGPDRFIRAEEAWRLIAEAAEIEDPVRLPGSGLIALGTFAFADDSEKTSVLIVPRLLVARHRGSAWVTEISRIDGAGSDAAGPGSAVSDAAGSNGTERDDPERSASDLLHSPAPLGPWDGTELREVADPATYLDGVAEATRRIAEQKLEKVVLARQLSGELDAAADLRVPLSRLAERYLDCWTFAVDGLIGASPETLIRSTDGAVSVRVLAGTRARRPEDPVADARASHDLLTSAKEQHEHAFAVQSVVTALAPYVRNLQSSDEAFALELPNVWHLATDLGARISGISDGPEAGGRESVGSGSTGGGTGTEASGSGPATAGATEGADDPRSRHAWGRSLSLVAGLHPTAAVAGTPTAAAVEAIAELEPFDRGRYAGAVGWIDASGDGEWVIALRCAQLGPVVAADDSSGPATGPSGVSVGASSPADSCGRGGTRTITATAGGGIVAGSVAEHELSETVSKFRPIAEAFGR